LDGQEIHREFADLQHILVASQRRNPRIGDALKVGRTATLCQRKSVVERLRMAGFANGLCFRLN